MAKTNSGSRFSVLMAAVEKKVEILSEGTEGKAEQKEIEAKIKRIDDETKLIKEKIMADPVDEKLIKEQAEATLNQKKSDNKRRVLESIEEAEDTIKQYEQEYEATRVKHENRIAKAKRTLEMVKDTSKEWENRKNLEAQQEYERTISSAGNIEQTRNLKIKDAERQGEQRKMELNARLDKIKARNDAQDEILDEFNKLYKDVSKSLPEEPQGK